MGDVYQATDSKLGRSVAVKFLPEAFARDADRVTRFEREARVLASLNHPNIAAIYGLEDANDKKFLVMELVAGETLAEKIQRGPIPVEEALGIAKQIAEALEAAHEKGIIHRDLKPANIKITGDGKVKVLDFGLAKGYEQSAANAALSNSPTMATAASMAGTNAGVIVGTAGYMSPEQARGSAVDKRADIWAFGVVLYQMLTGTQLFEGPTISDTLAHVLTKEPNWAALPQNTPAPIRRVLRRCLEKDRKRRIADAADARLEIEDALTSPAEAAGIQAAASQTRERFWMGVAAILLIGIASLAIPAVRYLRQAPPSQPVMRFTADLGEDALRASTVFGPRAVLSPDGKVLAFVAAGETTQLYVRHLDQPAAVLLTGTQGARNHFFSPDGQWILCGWKAEEDIGHRWCGRNAL
jgi:eukaryotic-like serine/threonine-protein kinase